VPQFRREHPKLKVKLFKDRAEFRRINSGLGWAEAFYRKHALPLVQKGGGLEAFEQTLGPGGQGASGMAHLRPPPKDDASWLWLEPLARAQWHH
jgi:hypothetical protein